MKKNLIFLMGIIILFSSCTAVNHHLEIWVVIPRCGFWMGLWHGMISPITFIISLFSDTVTVWDVNNNGGWYTFGFLIGVGSLTVSSTKSASK